MRFSAPNLKRSLFSILLGTSIIQVSATDADDPTYGNSARVLYSILQGQPYFSVDSKTGIYAFFFFIIVWFSRRYSIFCY